MSLRENMAIIKVEVSIPELRKSIESFKRNRINALSQLTNDITTSISNSVNTLLNAEIVVFLGQENQ